MIKGIVRVALSIAVLLAFVALWSTVFNAGAPRMPRIPADAVSDGTYAMGTLPCGHAYLETLHQPEADWVVWKLGPDPDEFGPLHVVAIVRIDRATGTYHYWVDRDFDGIVNLEGDGHAGDGAGAHELYEGIDGCRNLEGFR